MRNLAREAELERLIYEKVESCNKKSWLRLKRTFLIISGGIYLLALCLELENRTIDIKYLLLWLCASPVAAGFIMLIAYGILYYIITGSMEEEKELAELKGKWIERKYFINRED